MSVRVGIGLGQGVYPSDSRGVSFLWEFIDRCESSPIDSIWLSDRIVGESLVLEPITVLAAIAARTKRLKFGPSVLALPLRNPVVLAKEVATLDYISNGRMLCAVGLGGDNEAEYTATGTEKKERAGRTDEAIFLMRRLWTEDHVTHQGRFYRCDDIAILPKPVQNPPPVWIGGRSDAALRRTARLGDGWLAAAVSPQEMAKAVQAIFEYAKNEHRQFDPGHIGAIVGYCMADSKEKALGLAQASLLLRRPDLPLEEYSAIGTPEVVRTLLKRYVEGGASKFVMRPTCPPDQLFQQMDLLVKEVIPYIYD